MIVEINIPTFDRNIRYLRQKYHLSRRALASLAGISQYLLCRIEDEEPELRLNAHRLTRFRNIFDLPLEDLIHSELYLDAQKPPLK